MNKVNRGTNIVAVGAYNERLVLSILRTCGALSKAELAKVTGLSKQTLTDVIGRLEADGLLLRGDPIRGRIGQPQVPFVLNPDGAFSIGFKIGRKSYELVLMGFAGQTLKWMRKHIDYPMPDSMTEFVVAGLSAIRVEFPSAIMKKCLGMGVAMPNELWRWGEEFDAPEDQIATWRDFKVQEALEAVAGMSVTISNDVAAACTGELIFGKEKTSKDFLYAYIGTFIGGGVVLNGNILRGSRLNAGALGSMLIPDSTGARYGRQLLSVASIIDLVHSLMAQGRDTSCVWDPESDWAGIEDLVAPWIERVASHMATACISAAAITDVPQIIIDGSMPASVRERIVESTSLAISKLPTTGLSPFTVQAGTLGYSARVIGAASIPTQTRFANDFEALLKADPAR